jgi:hypothetical protein
MRGMAAAFVADQLDAIVAVSFNSLPDELCGIVLPVVLLRHQGTVSLLHLVRCEFGRLVVS